MAKPTAWMTPFAVDPRELMQLQADEALSPQLPSFDGEAAYMAQEEEEEPMQEAINMILEQRLPRTARIGSDQWDRMPYTQQDQQRKLKREAAERGRNRKPEPSRADEDAYQRRRKSNNLAAQRSREKRKQEMEEMRAKITAQAMEIRQLDRQIAELKKLAQKAMRT